MEVVVEEKVESRGGDKAVSGENLNQQPLKSDQLTKRVSVLLWNPFV